MKAAAARRASLKTTRSHAKAERFYCRVATRHAATVTKPRSAAQTRNRTLQTSASSRALAAAAAQQRAQGNQGAQVSQGDEGIRSERQPGFTLDHDAAGRPVALSSAATEARDARRLRGLSRGRCS